MVALIKLEWEALVDSVEHGDYEPSGQDGDIRFMYCDKTNTFVSNPEYIRSVLQARSHRNPFYLEGPLFTGKNVFLQLVARGDARGLNRVEFFDENINEASEAQLDKFFGPDKLIDKHRNALIYFDYLQNALTWT